MIFSQGLKGIITSTEAEKLSDYGLELDSSSNVKPSIKYKVNKAVKTVTVYLPNLSPKELATLKKAIKSAFEADQVILIEESKANLLERLYKYNDKEDNRTLQFFKPILSNLDWQALRDSLFLRNQFNTQGGIGSLKSDIVSRYGERGNTISNLCTAGYFEDPMMALFNSSQQEFWRYYDIAIDRGITAFFVNGSMTVEKIQSEIKARLKSAQLYGLPFIHIHGIGKKNIENVRKFITKEKGTIKFTEKIVFTDPGMQVIIVEIIL